MNRLRTVPFKNMTPYVVSQPDRIDMVVKSLQASLAEIGWMDKSFSRAVMMSHVQEGNRHNYPGVFHAAGYDFVNLLCNDNFSAYCFFFAHDRETPINYNPRIRNTYRRNLSCIVWMNLQKIDNTRGDDFFEELKSEVLSTIKNTRFLDSTFLGSVESVIITDVFDEPENIFENFTIDLTDTQFLYYPYRGIRVELDCYYLEKCELANAGCVYNGGNIYSGSPSDGWQCELINSGRSSTNWGSKLLNSGSPSDGWT